LKQLTDYCQVFQAGPGSNSKSSKIEYFVEARYPQQIWEIDVPVAKGYFENEDDVKELMSAFHSVHEGIFEISDLGSDVEFVTWRAKVSCQIRETIIDKLNMTSKGKTKPNVSRPVFFEKIGWVDTKVFSFEHIDTSKIILGPAIVESSFTTVVIEPGSKSYRDNVGSLIIEVSND
jgi:N-methylhydantoinase A